MYRESQDNASVDNGTLDPQTYQQSYENFCPQIGQQCPFLTQGADSSMTRQRYHHRPYHHYYYHHPYYHYYPYYPYFPFVEYEDHDYY